jgi:hypothetical protein
MRLDLERPAILRKKEVRQSDSLTLQRRIQPAGPGILDTSQVVSPNGRVNDDHLELRPSPAAARLAQIAFPLHLATERANCTLSMGVNQ